MFRKTMTGDPIYQQNHTSIFNFEQYPPTTVTNVPLNWTSPLPTMPAFQSPHAAQFANASTLGNFSFGSQVYPSNSLVQFPFDANSKMDFDNKMNNQMIRCKRKTDSPPLQPSKQHITEEKMAEHMAKLHINSETASSKESQSTRSQRLYMCEEMRKLQSESILPATLLEKFRRPCTALVLWQPPTRLLPVFPPDSNDNNNEDSQPDQNQPRIQDIDIEEDAIGSMEMDNL